MKKGELIYSEESKVNYTILQSLKSGGQAETAFASNDVNDKIYFIKRLLSIKYTEKTKDECKAFEVVQKRLYSQLLRRSTDSSSCPKIIDFFREKTFYYVVTERIIGVPCDTDQLFKSFTIQERLDLFKIMVYSIYALEQNNIVHGDIKPDNLLLKKVNNHYVSKLIDLESAFFSFNPPNRGCVVGTDPYSSPELVDYNDEDSEIEYELSSKSDIFSLGVILYELVCGEYPNSSSGKEYAFDISKRQEKLIFQEYVSEELKSLISSMLNVDPNKRPDVLSTLRQLKSIIDVSAPIDYYPEPQIVVEHVSQEIAYIHLFSLKQGGVIKFSIDDLPEDVYEKPIRIEDDDVPIRAHFEMICEDGSLRLSKQVVREVSVTCDREGKVDKPRIEINDGIVTITTITEESSIYYTIDGSLPSRKSLLYMAPLSLPDNIIVKAIAIKRGMYNSVVTTCNTSSTLKIS